MNPSDNGGNVQKAYILLVDPPTSGANIPALDRVIDGTRRGEITFMFNPASYTLSKGACWGRETVAGAPTVGPPKFLGAQPTKMDLEILIDHAGEETPKVAAEVDLLLTAVVPTRESLASGVPSPPWAVFGWGERIPMVAFVDKVSASYTLFRADGVPLRAKCTVSLEEVPTKPAVKQNPTSGSDREMRQHVVVAGDSLPSIASRAYGETARWRGIAEVNGIDDPMRLVEGSRLLLPHVADLDLVLGA